MHTKHKLDTFCYTIAPGLGCGCGWREVDWKVARFTVIATAACCRSPVQTYIWIDLMFGEISSTRKSLFSHFYNFHFSTLPVNQKFSDENFTHFIDFLMKFNDFIKYRGNSYRMAEGERTDDCGWIREGNQNDSRKNNNNFYHFRIEQRKIGKYIEEKKWE